MAQKTIVGLDIGTNKLRAVEALQGSQPRVIGVASITLPPHVVVGGEVRDHIAFAQSLKDLWKLGKFTARDVRVVFNNENNTTQLMTLDDEVDFGKTLPFRLKKYDISSTENYISYHTLRKYEVQEEDKSSVDGFKIVPKRDIFLAAVKRPVVDAILSGFARTDLRIISLDLIPLALIRGEKELSSYPEHNEVDIHVNVGGDTNTIVITNHTQPVFVRVVNSAGNGITEYIADMLNVSIEEAERLKLRTLTMNPALFQRQGNVESVFGSLEDTPKDDSSLSYSAHEQEAYDIVNGDLSQIIENVSQGVFYFMEHNKLGIGSQIDNLYISGATAAFGKIKHHLSLEIGAKNTTLSKPFSFLYEAGLVNEDLMNQFYPTQHEYTVAVGAVIGNGGEKND